MKLQIVKLVLTHRASLEAGPPPHGAARMRNVRDAASCCATSEWLLWYAQSRYAGSGSGTGEIPVRRTAALEPDKGHFTLLRDSSHACARSLSPRYSHGGAYALLLQQKHGLSVATSSRLRQLFGEGNVSACRHALEV